MNFKATVPLDRRSLLRQPDLPHASCAELSNQAVALRDEFAGRRDVDAELPLHIGLADSSRRGFEAVAADLRVRQQGLDFGAQDRIIRTGRVQEAGARLRPQLAFAIPVSTNRWPIDLPEMAILICRPSRSLNR